MYLRLLLLHLEAFLYLETSRLYFNMFRIFKHSTLSSWSSLIMCNGNSINLISVRWLNSPYKFSLSTPLIVFSPNIFSHHVRYLHCSTPKLVSSRVLEIERTSYGNLFYQHPYAAWFRPVSLGIWVVSLVILGNLFYGFTSHTTPHLFSARLVLQSVLPLSNVLLGALCSAVLSRNVVQRLYFDPRTERLTAITGILRRRAHYFEARDTEVLASHMLTVLRFTSDNRPFFVRTILSEDELSKEFQKVIKLIANIRSRESATSKFT